MRIEVSVPIEDKSNKKKKGDLLEEFAHELAKTQDYEVLREVRTASSEIDLLCKDRSTGEQIYLECKAHRDPLPKNVLTNLVGVVMGEEYSQGWLVSTGPLTKDARGYRENWSKKDPKERAKLKVHSEEELARVLISARLVKDPVSIVLSEAQKPGVEEIEWVLLVTEYGRFWTAARFSGGLAVEVYAYNASDLSPIYDPILLKRLSSLDCGWSGKSFVSPMQEKELTERNSNTHLAPVVEILEGKNWSDYLPARLTNFSGRKTELKQIFDLLGSAATGKQDFRVFAITGESGIGKSSLIASIRGRSQQKNNKKKYYVVAIDCRAAKSKDYIVSSLIRGLSKAQESGFGSPKGSELVVSNPTHPLSSPSISEFLSSVAAKNQAICIVFDQFEEIYSKPELEEVFSAAQELFLSAISEKGPLVLGFAWRSNFVVQQDHGAYFMWHNLTNYRLEMQLKPLEPSEVNSALTIFEKELAQRIRVDTRKQLVEAARGYPWLLKKLCLHLLKQAQNKTIEQAVLEDTSIENLFSDDLKALSNVEKKALDHIANAAPIARFEIEERFGEAVVKSLEGKLLVMRSGEMLNIYWDIFRDFILNGTVPDLPFSFIPASPSIASLLSVANELKLGEKRSLDLISQSTGLAVGTVGNIVRDLLILGVASGSYSNPELAPSMNSEDPRSTMRQVRLAMSRHTLLRELVSSNDSGTFSEEEIAKYLSAIPSVPEYGHSTLSSHVKRLCSWFAAAGFLLNSAKGWQLSDIGDVDLSYADKRRRNAFGSFHGSSTPVRALEVLKVVKESSRLFPADLQVAGYDNACNDLSRLGLIVKLEKSWSYVKEESDEGGISDLSRLYKAAKRQPVLIEAAKLLREDRKVSGPKLAEYLADHFDEKWSEASRIRIGNSVKRWSKWVIECDDLGFAIEPKEGERGKHHSKRTTDKVEAIRELRRNGATWKATAEKVGVAIPTAQRWHDS